MAPLLPDWPELELPLPAVPPLLLLLLLLLLLDDVPPPLEDVTSEPLELPLLDPPAAAPPPSSSPLVWVELHPTAIGEQARKSTTGTRADFDVMFKLPSSSRRRGISVGTEPSF